MLIILVEKKSRFIDLRLGPTLVLLAKPRMFNFLLHRAYNEPMSKPIFLSANWRHLCLLNYEIDPEILQPHLPHGTELDFFKGRTFVSLVAFMFYRTKAFGIVPAFFHQTFEEINLRFYVTRKEEGQIKRGVVFIKEIVPKPILAFVARTFYSENYVSMVTSHKISTGISYEYSWGENHLKVTSSNTKIEASADSLERWITEHYWGYTKVGSQKTFEYEVKHPIWNLYEVRDYTLSGDMGALYGQEFAPAFLSPPSSIFIADGSEITVHMPRLIR
jgi:uncharacterized protein YqjF (DUF2071 family)